MNNLLVWRDISQIGTEPIVLSCKRLCFEPDDFFIENISSMGIYEKKRLCKQKKYSDILLKIPRCIIQTFGVEPMEKILSNSNGLINIFHYNEYMTDANKKIILESNFCCCIEFVMEKIISEILRSYSVDKSLDYMDNAAKIKILKQLEIDFPRMELCYNSVRCNSIYEFKTNIEKFNRFSHDTMYTLYYLIVMMSTQATFFYPFSILHNIYTLHDNGIHILPDEDHPFVNIIDNQTNLNIIFRKVMKYFNINSQETITKIHTYMMVTIELGEADGHFFYGKKCVGSSSGSLYWIKEKKLVIV